MKKKNIIFICTDQQRADTLSCYDKNTLCKTPSLDQLAAESVVFDNAYTTCPVCTPARSSMQTGLYPSKTGMETNSFRSGCAAHELSDAPYLLSRRLQAAGYNCGFTGKWHLGLGKDKEGWGQGRGLIRAQAMGDMKVAAYLDRGSVPTDLGYIGDDFPGHGGGGWNYAQYRQYLKENHLELKIINKTPKMLPADYSKVGEVVSPIASTVEYFLVERAKAIIDELSAQDKPFYFQLCFWGPHSPFFAPTKYLDLYRDMTIPENPTFREPVTNMPRLYDMIRRPEVTWDFFQEALRYYYASTSHTDAQIGRLMDYLKEKGLYEDTMIIFAADHGDNHGCHGGLENKSYSMYDDTTKIPLLIKPAESGFRSYHQSALVGTCDIYATILKEAGFTPSDDYGYGDGRPLNPFFAEKDLPWSDEISTQGLGAFNILATQRMFRKGKYKYVFNAGSQDQLFDMEADPHEARNLVDEPLYQPVLLWMKNCFADWMDANGDILRDDFCKVNHIKQWQL